MTTDGGRGPGEGRGETPRRGPRTAPTVPVRPATSAPSEEITEPRTQDGRALYKAIMGAVLVQLRMTRGMSAGEMTNESGISKPHLSNSEGGRDLASRSIARLFEHTFDLKRHALIDLRDELEGNRNNLATLREIQERFLPGLDINVLSTSRAQKVHLPSELFNKSAEKILTDKEERRLLIGRVRKSGVKVLIVVSSIYAALLLIVTGLQEIFPEKGISPAQDRADPVAAGCGPGDVGSTVGVYLPSQELVGILELRSSRRCKASWARLTTTTSLSSIPDTSVQFVLHRSTAPVAVFRDSLASAQAESGVLRSDRDCVWAEVTLISDGKPIASFRTECKRVATRREDWPLPFNVVPYPWLH